MMLINLIKFVVNLYLINDYEKKTIFDFLKINLIKIKYIAKIVGLLI